MSPALLQGWQHWCARCLALMLAAGAGSGMGAAVDDGARAQLEQRIRLTARLIGEAGTGQRIVASGHVRAVSHLNEGRVHQALAESALAAGDLATARREVDEALRHIGQARRLVPDTPARQAEARYLFNQRLATTERLLESWAARARAESFAGDIDDRLAVIGLVGQARQLSDDGRIDEATRVLARADGHLLTGMNRLLHQRTIDYTARSGSPAEAYQEALAQFDGLIDLVPLALTELRPGADALALVDRYSDTGRALRLQAVQRQQRGEHGQALADLRNATLYVHRALAAAGLAMPAPVE